jgi:peptidylprolyl isomerase
VRYGQEAINAIEEGTLFETEGFTPDVIRSMRVEADIAEDERTNIQVVDSNHPAFNAYLDSLRDASGALPDVCEIDIPTRIQD